MYRICPILFTCLLYVSAHCQHLANDVIGVSGKEIANTSISLNNTSGELVSSTINNNQIILTQGFQQTSQIFYLSPKAMLQGALIGSNDNNMRDDLRTGNYLPTTSPYNTLITESNNAFDISGDNAVVDWVMVKLRNSNFRVISEKSALVQKDGDIVSADGVSPLQFTTQNNEYHVEINHRNHLGTMTRNEVVLNNGSNSLNFINGSLLTYGNLGQAEINSNTYALWAGNANGDDRIRYQGSSNDSNFIRDQVRFHPNNPSNSNFFVFFDYDNADINLDGKIRFQGSGNDVNFIRDIIRFHPNNPSSSNFFSILQQTPF